jgi:hypothetical protein
MLPLNESGKHHGKPPCARCQGTGYVYLWSVGRSGDRTWYCDRNNCKRWWTVANLISSVPVVELAEVSPLVQPVAV